MIATVSEALVLQKTIKEVWYICLEALNHMLLPMLKWEHCDQADFLVFPLHNYTHRQCHALDTMMEIFKVCAHVCVSVERVESHHFFHFLIDFTLLFSFSLACT